VLKNNRQKSRDKAYYLENKQKILDGHKERYSNNSAYRENSKLNGRLYRQDPVVKENIRKRDRIYDAIKMYGKFWESAILVRELEKEVNKLVNGPDRLVNRRHRRVRSLNKLQATIAKIQNGEAGIEILKYSWSEENKEILEDYLVGWDK